MKIAICQINTTIGDFDNNAKRMIEGIGWAKGEGAELVVYGNAEGLKRARRRVNAPAPAARSFGDHGGQLR